MIEGDFVIPVITMWKKQIFIARDGWWDRAAVMVSGLCLIHCLSTMIFVALLSSVAGILVNPLIHEIGLGIAIALGMIALGRGILDHGYLMPAAIGSLGIGMMMGAISIGHANHAAGHSGAEIVYTMLGVAVLALGHDLNYRATH